MLVVENCQKSGAETGDRCKEVGGGNFRALLVFCYSVGTLWPQSGLFVIRLRFRGGCILLFRGNVVRTK